MFQRLKILENIMYTNISQKILSAKETSELLKIIPKTS